MLTLLTQKAIAILHDIAAQDFRVAERYKIIPDEMTVLLAKMERKELIARKPGGRVDEERDYNLCRPLAEISLLDVLEAVNENLNCNHPTTEEFYTRYGKVAHRLGVVNHMTRLYLAEIKLTEC